MTADIFVLLIILDKELMFKETRGCMILLLTASHSKADMPILIFSLLPSYFSRKFHLSEWNFFEE